MNIPKSISPDRLKDALVEVRYDSKLPFEIIVGTVFQNIDNTYSYTNRQTGNPIPGTNFNINISSAPLFYNDKIKVMLLPNSFIFNMISDYIGWEDYEQQISKVLKQITSNTTFINFFRRASVRYISEYEEDIKDCFQFSFSFGRPDIISDVFSFRSEFMQDNLKIFLNLQNNIKLNPSNKDNRLSIVDVDVLNDDLNITDLKSLMCEIAKAHEKQKIIFFSIMKPEFLKTLNPVY